MQMDEVHAVFEKGLGGDELIVDVRHPDDFAEGHVPGARNLPFDRIRDAAEELRRFKRVYLHCGGGGKAEKAFATLSALGLTNLAQVCDSGMRSWEAAGWPVERSLDLQPSLEGKLLRLRPLRAEDFDALYAVASDPLLWAQHPRSDRYKRDVFEKLFADALSSGGALVALDTATGEVIGSSRYYGSSPAERSVIIGYTFLSRSRWGGKFNAEMKRLMLEHAFRHVDRVAFESGAKNRRSR